MEADTLKEQHTWQWTTGVSFAQSYATVEDAIQAIRSAGGHPLVESNENLSEFRRGFADGRMMIAIMPKVAHA